MGTVLVLNQAYARPGGGRPNGGRPNGGRPDGGRTNGGRPNGGRPNGGRPGGRPHGMRPRICYMEYTNITDGVTGDFKLSSCGSNFNCEAINVTKIMFPLNVTKLSICKPETNCENMECLPTEECIPPRNTSSEEENNEDSDEDSDEDTDEDSDEESDEDSNEFSNEDSDEDSSEESDDDSDEESDENKRRPGKPNHGGFRPKPHRFAHCVPKKISKPDTMQ